MALTTKNIIPTVFGDMRVVIGEVVTDTTADYFDTGLDFVHYVNLVSENAQGATDIQVIRNSNNGTQGSSNGNVWVDVENETAPDAQFIAIGK